MTDKISFIIDESDEAHSLRLLHYDIETKIAIINKIFSTNKNDLNDNISKSLIYKEFYNTFNKNMAEYDIKKELFGTNFLKPIILKKINKKEVEFNWELNFQTLEVKVELIG